MRMQKARRCVPRTLLSLALCLSMAVGLLPAAALAAESQPAVSSNRNRQDYTTYGKPVTSHLYANGEGLTRVEYIDGQVVVEDYDSTFHLQSSRTIAPELPIWGGFYAGETFNFLFFGQKNPSESKTAEVIRVVKYDKNWNRLGQTCVKGANTTIPFDAGSLRCDEYGGYLYVRTCHQMFRSDDGLNHQSNMTLQIRQSDMSLADAFYDIWVVDWGYISHSFNQFILVDQDRNLVALDHSDANSMTMGANYVPQNVVTRGAVLVRYDLAKAGSAQFSNQRVQKWCSFRTVQPFAGSNGNNVTGASLGGLAETSSGYVSAYSYDGVARSGDRNVYLGYTAKGSLNTTTAKVTSSAGATTPVLVPTGLEGGYLLWNGKSGSTANDTLYYTNYSASGKAGSIQTASAPLSDCQPIVWNGKLVWYVTDRSAPVFYTLDASGVQRQPANGAGTTTPTDPGTTTPTDPGTSNPSQPARFSDVPASHWAYPYVEAAAAKGIVDGVGNGKFNPDGTMTYAEFCVMLDKAFFPEAVAQYAAQASGKPWYWPYLTAAYRSGLAPSASAESSFQRDWTDIANVKLSRYEMARIILPLLDVPSGSSILTEASAKLKDWSQIPSAYRQPVAAALHNGVIGGTDTGAFAGSSQITRAQACVILLKLLEVGSAPQTPEPEPEPEPVTLSLSQSVLSLIEGRTFSLRATLSGASAPITYRSSSPSVASVNSSGVVTAKSAGTATVTASASAGGKTYTATCAVTVNAAPVQEEDFTVSVNPAALTLTTGETGRVRGSVSGTSSPATFRYWSSDNSILAVDDNGAVTAKAAGTAKVMVTAMVGTTAKSASCAVTVKEKPAPAPDPGTETPGDTSTTSPEDNDRLYMMSKIITLSTRNSQLLIPDRMDAQRQLWGDISGVTWTNESPELLALRGSTVSALGQTGTGYITAHYKGQSQRITVRVIPLEDQIALSCLGLNMRADSYGTTSLYVFDTSKFYGQDYTIQWSVDDPSILTLEEREVNGYPSVRFTGTGVAGDARVTCRVTMADGTWAEEYCFVHTR